MSVCCCSLAGTKACDRCSNGPASWSEAYRELFIPGAKKRKKITERYNEEGKLIERIIEE